MQKIIYLMSIGLICNAQIFGMAKAAATAPLTLLHKRLIMPGVFIENDPRYQKQPLRQICARLQQPEAWNRQAYYSKQATCAC